MEAGRTHARVPGDFIMHESCVPAVLSNQDLADVDYADALRSSDSGSEEAEHQLVEPIAGALGPTMGPVLQGLS